MSASPDGTLLTIATDRVDLWDLRAECLRESLTCELSYHASRAVFARSGRLYIWGMKPGRVSCYDPQTRQVLRTHEAPYESGQFITISADERRLCLVGASGYGADLLDLDASARLFPEELRRESHAAPVVLSPDGSLLVSLGEALRGRRVPAGAEWEEGPLSGLSGFHPAAAEWAAGAPLFAYAALNYRGESARLLWAPCVEEAV